MTSYRQTKTTAPTVTGRTYTHTRPRGAAPWAPREQTRVLLGQVADVLAEYRDYLPLTARQVFYRLVGAYGYEKTEAAYSRLLDALNRGRRAGLVSWSAIRDDGVTHLAPPCRAGVSGFWSDVRGAVESYRLDRQAGQPGYLELWCEAAGMAPQLARAADAYGVPVYSSGGFDSVTAKHDAAERFAGRVRGGQTVTVLHVGDFDPSGCAIVDAAAADVVAFCEAYGGAVTFSRLAVTPEQILSHGLPTAPQKRADRRGPRMAETVQAEALDPATLAGVVRAAIIARMDTAQYRAVLAREHIDRAAIEARMGAILDS